ncbi:MAG: FKBP-type peptidyl-prolyl cis-trans isomerase [Planctomycetes bacterium]|nr:FKBP-type peptidyl-prolyl cis-trans isomerase [Planctomycetota bacterium]
MILPLSAFAQNAQPRAAQPAKLETTKDKASYVIGVSVGRKFRMQGLEAGDFATEAFIRGFRDALAGAKSQISDDQVEEVMTAFQKDLEIQIEARRKAQLERNEKEGAAFLAANAKKQGVKSLKSGLQYQVLREGTGKSPTAEDTVQAHYRGTLINGEVFDQSYEGKEPTAQEPPVEFSVSGVIKGWIEALQLMKVGSKWRLFIPGKLAYDNRPDGPGGPGSVLVFDVELVGVSEGGTDK